ncbi:MAG: hypothetical protein Q9214_000457 [Letrouitia sp. 1 TL-2023]
MKSRQFSIWKRERPSDYRDLPQSEEGSEKWENENELRSSRSSTATLPSDVERCIGTSYWLRRSYCNFIWIATAINVVVSVTTLILFLSLPYRRSTELNYALKQISSYSPVLDAVEIPLVNKQVDGGLFPSERPLLGRLEPGPATDEIWQDWEIQRSFVLSREEVIELGKDPDKSVKYPDEDFGFGEEAYMGGLDIFHVIHCFDAIRQEAFKEYYWDGEKYHMEGYSKEAGRPKRTHTEIFWLHLRHCTDIVLQSLMCNADTTMTTMTWLETQQRPFPDFSVNKKCRDFDAIVRWRDDNALDVKKAGSVTKPEGGDQTKISEMYWKLFGNDTSPGDNRHHPLWD